VRRPDFNIELVADISCDIDGPVASTIRPSTIADPHYGYDPKTEKEVAFDGAGAVTVMAVDNLPCELPRDASFDFGEMFIHHVLPSFLNGDKHGILDRATIAQDGKITDHYSYLREWVNS
jgi:alanine dehydrogenase